MARKTRKKTPKKVETLVHDEAKRTNIPTAELESVMDADDQSPIQVAYQRRNPDLDPQLIWRGKDLLDPSELVVQAPPLFIQEKVHPKVLVDDLMRRSERDRADKSTSSNGVQLDLFADFNGIADKGVRAEFYEHDANWTSRMILGDSLQVMASLAEREGLRGKVQCIYLDPPYGIKFNSNFQWSTTSRDVKDGNAAHITREPEQVKAFRDTWRDGIHSYLTYLRDRLMVARDLLSESGSIFIQIGDENVHLVRTLMDEVFGKDNYCAVVQFRKTGGLDDKLLSTVSDNLVWYARSKPHTKFRKPFRQRPKEKIVSGYNWIEESSGRSRRLTARENDGRDPEPAGRRLQSSQLMSQGETADGRRPEMFEGRAYRPVVGRHWSTTGPGMERLRQAGRLLGVSNTLTFRRYEKDFPVVTFDNLWDDTMESTFAVERIFVVQTAQKVVERCVLMTTDPGDLILDPTCGSGTAANVAEKWGRRWITIDTSRVALALARARIMGARYPYYLLADSPEGQIKEAEVERRAPSESPTYGDIRQGFVYERVPHVTLKSIANNAEIDVIWEEYQEELEPLREQLNEALGEEWEEWEIPRDAEDGWPAAARELHAEWWEQRIARQKEIDASIAAKADFEYLYDKPYVDNKKVRVAGPFTVESLSPHRALGVDENDELIDHVSEFSAGYGEPPDFAGMILENLKTAGVQYAHKEDRVAFSSLMAWPGDLICAEGRYTEGDEDTGVDKRAGIFIGPEFGTVSRPDLVKAAREAGDAEFDVLIACGFNYEAHATEFSKLGRIPVLKARMNADLHMADDLKNTGKGNLFVIFGEPDIDCFPAEDPDATDGQIQVRVNGVDVFHPNTAEIRSDGAEGIACWFIDTDYNEESFFVRHAYFLGANDPYKALKTTLKAEISKEAWETLHSDTSRPFDRPASGRIAVKVINHLGDEVMKVFRVD